jgi:phage shock protein A
LKSGIGTGKLNQKKPDAEDEWAHLTDTDGNETKIEARDAADVGKRNIFIGEKGGTPWEVVSKKTQNLADMTSNISQYVKLVNAYLQEQKKEVVKIKDSKNRFDLEIENLQNDNVQLAKLNDVQIDNLDANGLKKFAQKLTQVRDSRRGKINQLKTEITKTEEELKKQDIQITKINDQIIEKEKRGTNGKNLTKDQLFKELSTIIQKYDGKTVANVLTEINSLK